MRFGLRTPALPNLWRKSPKVSGRFREYSRFGETIGGDGFDRDCRFDAGRPEDRSATNRAARRAGLSELSGEYPSARSLMMQRPHGRDAGTNSTNSKG